MGSESTQKIGVAIYLRSRSPLRLVDFATDFRKRWPKTPLASRGQERNCVFLASGSCHLAVEFHPAPIPQAVTDAALSETVRRWPSAGDELSTHVAHLKVATAPEVGTELDCAAVLTKVVTSLLSVTDAIGLCWLNGPVLHSCAEFVGIATEMLGASVHPLILWVRADLKSDEHILHTTGMVQFRAPEILIAQQPNARPELLEYLFEVAYYVLTSGKEILEGETIDGPNCVFKISSINGNSDRGKRGLLLTPVQMN
jgi:hypothetical protein